MEYNLMSIKQGLISSEAMRNRRKEHKLLHISLVQVTIKPLFRLVLHIPVLLILRDKRHLKFENFLLSVLQSNLKSDLIISNCYPNYTIDLNYGAIINSLTLHKETKNLNFDERSKLFVVIYRIYYKVMSTNLYIGALISSPKQETLLRMSKFYTQIQFFQKEFIGIGTNFQNL